jgi:hypothetical protein
MATGLTTIRGGRNARRRMAKTETFGDRCATCRKRPAVAAPVPAPGGCCEPCWRRALASPAESDRSEAARRPGAPAWALAALAADQSPLVRAEVALRPDLPDEIVATLADPDREPDRTVLRRMAKHPALGANAPRLAAVDDLVVHRQLAGNPSTPATVLAVLSRHADPAVRQAARARLVGAALDPDGRSRLPVGVRNYLAAPIGRNPARNPRSPG